MPFQKQTPKPFTKDGIKQIPAKQGGVFGLFKNIDNPVWIFICKAWDFRTELSRYLSGTDINPHIRENKPTHFVIEQVDGDPSQREQELRDELNPVC